MDATATQNQPGWYTVELSDVIYRLPERYQTVKFIGRGAFGSVISAQDTVLNKKVAIKKMIQPFRSATHAKRTYRELRLLMHLNHPDSQVVQLYNVFTPDQNVESFESLYFVFNFVDYDLNRVIKRRRPFIETHIQQLIYSLLRGVKFLHSAHVIHRDIKPANIGVDKASNLTIFDFGLARVANDGIQTGYVATRWWRAPEVFVNWERYDEKLDIWSVGCVMGELILLEPVFPGTDYIDQIRRILAIVGTPDVETLNQLCQPRARDFILEMTHSEGANFQGMFGYKFNDNNEVVSGVSEEGVAFLKKLLTFDPRQRPTAEEALNDPFLQQIRDAESEPTIAPFDDPHQDANYETPVWKRLIWELAHSFHPPAWITQQQ